MRGGYERPKTKDQPLLLLQPYEMISIAELDAATAAASAAQRALRGYPYDRVERERAYAKYVREQDSEVDDRYIDLCGTASPNRVMGDDDEVCAVECAMRVDVSSFRALPHRSERRESA